MAAELNICSPITGQPLPRVVKTTGQECAVNAHNLVSTAGGAVALTLPQSFADDTCVVVEDSSGNAAANNITISGGANGQLIDGEVSVTISRNRGAYAFVRDAKSSQWGRAWIPRLLDGARVRLYTQADAAAFLQTPPVLVSMNYDQGDTAGGGASIVFTGSNFTALSVAYFDGVAATTVGWTATTLTCTLPAHVAGAVLVSAKNGGAESNKLPFTYWSPLDTDGAGTRLAGLTGLWRANGATGYTFVNGGVGARSGTLIDAIAAANAVNTVSAPPAGAAAGGHVPPQATRSTGYLHYLQATALSNFIAANLFTMWSFTETPSEGFTSWPDGTGTWTGCYLISNSSGGIVSGGPVLGLTGQNVQPSAPGSAHVVVYDGGIKNAQVDGLALDTPYHIVGSLSGGTLRIRAAGLTATVASGNVGDRTPSVRFGVNANGSVAYRGPQYEHALMNQLLSDPDRAKVLKYGQQRYGRAFT